MAIARTAAMLWLLHALVFAIFDLLPDAAYSRLGAAALERRTLEMTRQQLGLSGSAWDRYSRSLSNVLRGDLGRSVQSGYPVALLLRQRAAVSMPIVLLAFAVSALAMLAAARWFSTPSLSRAQRMVLAASPAAVMPQFASASALAVFSGLIVAAVGLGGRAHQLLNDTMLVASVAIMPAGVLFLAAARSAQDVLRRRFVLTFLAMGSSWSDIRRLVQPNILQAMVPLCARVALAIVTGTVFAELCFNRPGIGATLAEAIRSGDQAVACGWILAVAAPVIVVSQLSALASSRFPPA